MIPIHKTKEPNSLIEYRLKTAPEFDRENFTSVKQAIREQLVVEQGYLCAYCMRRIEPDAQHMKVEHWQSRTKYPQQQLVYGNLLGCCYGNEGSDSDKNHCDTKKGDNDICFNPANPDHYTKLNIRYNNKGVISSSDTEFNRQLNDILNLNYSRLQENRKAVWNAVTKRLMAISGSATKTQVQNILTRWQQKDSNGQFKEYCGVAIYYLQKKLDTIK